ncbi:hypothetical protein GCM10009663_58710 [Kitasatospora arboriphila]|uniref:Uncharacterized protein n=1 Tax=Kitasatospora arboriphila TaxID=258052 RepID=A0ABN1TYT7_9ACTN
MTSISTAAETDKAMRAHTPSRVRRPGRAAGRAGRALDPEPGGNGTVRLRIAMSNTYPIGDPGITYREVGKRGAGVLRTAERPVAHGPWALRGPLPGAAPNE